MNAKPALSLLLVMMSAACSRTATSPPTAEREGVDAATSRESGSAVAQRSPPAAATVLPPLPTVTGTAHFKIPSRSEDTIEAVVPEHRPVKPPLLIAFHATGQEPENSLAEFDLVAKAEALGFVAIAPRAGNRDTKHPPDVDHPADWGGSSWNMWTAGLDANEDLVYVRALIDAAKKSWGVDTSRVYTAGFSNGAYFSYFVAASMPDRIAGFAEMSGGWTTDACPTRTDHDGTSQYLMTMKAPPGKEQTCSTLFADKRFPSKCRVTPANKLHEPLPRARVPFGFLAHYSTDDTVSVVWSCLLADGLGARAKTMIRAREADGTAGHTVMPDFIDNAFKFFAGRTNAQ